MQKCVLWCLFFGIVGVSLSLTIWGYLY
jgi:hypothetical protein